MLATGQDERSRQTFLNQNPDPIGWLFAVGISPATLVRPQFRLGCDFVADFMVVDIPQWTQVTLVEIDSPTCTAFKALLPRHMQIVNFHRQRARRFDAGNSSGSHSRPN